LIDRFGMLPSEVSELLIILSLKLKCKNLNISKVEFTRDGINISFNEKYFNLHDNLFVWIEGTKGQAQIKKNNLLFVKCFNKEVLESESAIQIIDSLDKGITQH